MGLGPDDGALGDEGLTAAIGTEPAHPTEALRRQMVIDKLPVEYAPQHTIELGIEAPGLSID